MTESSGRRFAWAVFGLVVLFLGSAMLWSLLGLGTTDDDTVPLASTGEVVVVGAPGLTWSDISESGTPTLWVLTGEGASAGLIVRGAHEVTCPADGWLTLSAGQRAAANDDGVQDCTDVPGLSLSGETATVPAWDSWQAAADRRPLDAELGTLAESLERAGGCVTTVGPLAALGGATDGVARDYRDGGLSAYAPGGCAVTLVDGGVVSGAADASALDAELANLRERLPDQATLVVAGLADREDRAGARSAVVWQEGMEPGALRSTTTRQTNLVQTTDLTATVLTLAGAQVPDAVSGAELGIVPQSASAAERVTTLQDLTESTDAAKALAYPVLGVGVLLALVALAALAVARRRTELRLLGLAAMAFSSAAFLAGVVPWWRAEPRWAALVAVIVLWVAVQVGLAMAGPWRRHPLGPPIVVAALTVVVLGVDVVLGGRLGLISMLGVQPVTAGRFHGMGNVGYGIFAVSGLLLAGFLASLLRSRPMARRSAAVLVVGVLGVLLVLVDGAPVWGADFGGVPALVVAVGVLGLAAAEIRLTPVRALLIAAAAVVVAGALMLLDWLRPAGSRTHLGDFLQSVIDGGAVDIVLRKLDQSLGILVRYPVSWVAVLVLVALVWAVASPGSLPGRRIAPLWQVPLLRATAVAVLTCVTIGWALNDSGIAIVGIGLAVAIAAAIAVGAGRHGPEPEVRSRTVA